MSDECRQPFAEPLRRGSEAGDADRPLVSIILRTVAYRLGCLREAVDSVLAQDYGNLEIVIVEDGGSAAAEWAASIELPPHVRLAVQSLPPVGRCVAGNRGLEIARGEYAGFLDDDNRLHPDHVSTIVEVLERRPELAGAYTLAERVFTQVDAFTPFVYQERSRDVHPREPFHRQALWVGNLFPIQAVLFRRRLYEEFGGFHEGLERLEDWDLWVRYTSREDFLLVDRITSLYRVPPDAGEEESFGRHHDSYFTKLRELQARVPVEMTREELRSLVRRILEEREHYRVALRFRVVDLRKELDRSPLVREFFERGEAGSGAVRTTPGEALALADRIVAENGRLAFFSRLAQRLQRLRRFVDRCRAFLDRGSESGS